MISYNKSKPEGQDEYHVPVIVGDAFFPLLPVYFSSENRVYYIIGPEANAFTISKVRSPSTWQGYGEWTSGGYALNQITRGGYKFLQAIIADSDGDGTVDAQGVWRNGDRLHAPNVLLSQSGQTSPYYPPMLVRKVLEDVGFSLLDIDTASFDAASTSFSAYNPALKLDGAIWYPITVEEVIFWCLNASDSELYWGRDGRLAWRIRGKSTDMTIQEEDVSLGQFSIRNVPRKEEDSQYVSFAPNDAPQDKLTRTLVAGTTGTTTDRPSSYVVELPLQASAANAKKACRLAFRRRSLAAHDVGFMAPLSLCVLEPGDVLSFASPQHGQLVIVVDSVGFTGLEMNIRGTHFEGLIEEWGDLSYVDDTLTELGELTSWQPVTAGPDGGGNALPGRLSIGDAIWFDPNGKGFEHGGAMFWVGGRDHATAPIVFFADGSMLLDGTGGYLEWDAATDTLSLLGSIETGPGSSISADYLKTGRIQADVQVRVGDPAVFVIDGGNSNGYVLWSGGELPGTATFWVKLDGSMKCVGDGGYLLWDAPNDTLEIKGTVLAADGSVLPADYIKTGRIAAGEAITLEDGADFILEGRDANPCILYYRFLDNATPPNVTYQVVSLLNQYNQFSHYPGLDGELDLNFGLSTLHWNNIRFFLDDDDIDRFVVWCKDGEDVFSNKRVFEILGTQKIGFFGATPVGRQLKADHNNWAAVSDVVQALVNLGVFDQT